MQQENETLNRLIINGPRVYRSIAFPVPAFDALQRLKREWGLGTNAEVLTRLLLRADTMKNENVSRISERDD